MRESSSIRAAYYGDTVTSTRVAAAQNMYATTMEYFLLASPSTKLAPNHKVEV